MHQIETVVHASNVDCPPKYGPNHLGDPCTKYRLSPNRKPFHLGLFSLCTRSQAAEARGVWARFERLDGLL